MGEEDGEDEGEGEDGGDDDDDDAADDDLAASDGRRFVFRIDDVSYELAGASPSAHHHRQPVCAVNEVDDEPFPDIEYLHACVAGDGVCLEAQPEFLVGCACDGCADMVCEDAATDAATRRGSIQ